MFLATSVPDTYRYSFIEKGYRAPNASIISSFCSIFQLHNETINIWSNIIPTLYFFISGVNALYSQNIVIPISLFSVGCGFLCSAIYHTFSATTPELSKLLNKLDFAGMYFIGFGASLPGIYYGYSMYPVARTIFIILNIVNAVYGMFIVFVDSMLHYKFARITTIALGASFGIAFTVCLGYLHGFTSIFFRTFASAVTKYFITLLIGVGVYVSHFPERWFPGSFDCIGHSHNWWHCIAALALVNLLHDWNYMLFN
jgi:adiponectin receptor